MEETLVGWAKEQWKADHLDRDVVAYSKQHPIRKRLSADTATVVTAKWWHK
jgi:hypothetical protein